MVQYECEEATQLLEQNLEGAKAQLLQLDKDLAYLRDQANTCEVGIARVYNYDVKLRRLQKETAEAKA